MRVLPILFLALLLGISAYAGEVPASVPGADREPDGASAGAAEDTIKFGNDMDTEIKALYCVNDMGAIREVAGPVGRESSISIDAAKFEADCTRIAVVMEDGSGWQFYHEVEAVSPASEIALSWESPSGYMEKKYPSLLIVSGDDPCVVPAGVPLFTLVQFMQFGMDEAMWKKAAMPGGENLRQPGAFVVSFADTAWSFSGKGIEYAALVKGMRLAKSVSLAAPFSNTTVMGIFGSLKQAACRPLLFTVKDMSSAFGEEGKALDENAVLIQGLADNAARWNSFDLLAETLPDSGGGKARLVFDNEEFMFDLTLDLDAAEAVLKVVRKDGTPFG